MLILVTLHDAYGVDALHDPKIESREVPLSVRQTLAGFCFDGWLAVDRVAPLLQ